MKRLMEFITDDSGKLSSCRFLIILSVLCYLVFAGHIVFTKGQLPDMPVGLTALISALYGLNKFSPTTQFRGGGQ
jgi:hypothetical protein